MKPVIAVTCSTHTPEGAGSQARDVVNRSYCDAIRRAGGTPVLLPAGGDADTVQDALAGAQGLLITGGVDIAPPLYGEETLPCCGEIDPMRDELDRDAITATARMGLPMLGICRGVQSMAVFLGGTLWQDIPTQIDDALAHRQEEPRGEATHTVCVGPSTLLAKATGAQNLPTNTFHHQAVKAVPPGFLVAARAEDGVIESIEGVGPPFRLGVQWHPEDMAAEHPRHQAIFDAFVEAGIGGR